MQLGTFYHLQDYEKLMSTKYQVFVPLVGPSERGKLQHIYNWFKIGTRFNQKMTKNMFFYQHLQPQNVVIQKEIDILELFQDVKFKFSDSFKNNSTSYLLIFDGSCEEFSNSKASDDIAFAGRHRGLSAFYNKLNLFHQNKCGREV